MTKIQLTDSIQLDDLDNAVLSERGAGQTFEEVVRARIARRGFLKTTALGVGLAAAPSLLATDDAEARQRDPGQRLRFTPIAPSGADAVIVPQGYEVDVVVRWGDPLTESAPAFDVDNQSARAQATQFGFNCDYIGELPLSKSRGTKGECTLLFVNHEYTSGRDMFLGYDPNNPTEEQVNTELAAHGASVVELVKTRNEGWTYDQSSRLNRRLTGETPIQLVGPLAGHPYLQTTEDPSGTVVRGMLNNCGGGVTPWGTVLSCEENFDQYFANGSALAAADPTKAALYARLPAPGGASFRKWERFHSRFDVALEPNEYARFGYIVEIDPYDPSSTARKQTALGRVKHEGAFTVLSGAGHAVVYSGDDARFEYFYKFVSKRKYRAGKRKSNMRLLERGTLYVAKLYEDGTGEWLPLVQGQGPLTAVNGFPSQAEVLVNTRGAADLLGATKMDRPEDIDVSPVTNKVYVALTNNSARTAVTADPGEAAANPRLGNRWGQILEVEEDGGDNAATTFRWDLPIICGDPASTPGTYFSGFDPSLVSPISCPDNLDFDDAGNLWIATDGASASPGFSTWNDAIHAVPVEGAERGYVRQFLSGVSGCEVASLKHSLDGRTLFATIQHPGEDGGLPNTISSWPDGTNYPPRGSLIAVRHRKGKKIGA